jgi:hypothetical protein
MKKELFQQIKHARGALALTIIFGVLGAIVMIAQMAFLSRIVSLMFMAHLDLAQVHFAYPTSAGEVLDGITLRMHPGSWTAAGREQQRETKEPSSS